MGIYKKFSIKDGRLKFSKLFKNKWEWKMNTKKLDSSTKDLVPIEKVKIYCYDDKKINFEHEINSLNEQQSIIETEYGTFVILDSDFERGIFSLKFKSAENYKNSILCEIYSIKDYIDQFKEQKEMYSEQKDIFSSELDFLDIKRQNCEKNLRDEEININLKTEKVCNDEKQKKYELIKNRFNSLHFCHRKLFNFLINFNKAKFDQFNFDSEAKLKQSFEAVFEKMNNNPRDFTNEEKNFIEKISNSIGLSAYLLYQLLDEIKTNETSYEGIINERNKSIKIRNDFLVQLQNNKQDFEKNEKKIKIFDEVQKVVKLESNKDYVNNQRDILASKIFETYIDKQDIVDFEIIIYDDHLFHKEEDLEDEQQIDEHFEEKDSIEIIKRIDHNFKFKRFLGMMHLRNITIDELRRTSDNVSLNLDYFSISLKII